MQNPGYVTQQPNVTVVMPGNVLFGENPMQVTCGNCRRTVISTTRAENGSCTIVAVIILLIVFFPCMCVPLCSDSCKDIHHYCPSCGARLGEYKRL
ncbi:Lipopolysaccharide-induced tumor necrosis like protein [Argiope bruennichi]|uniref:Lipopolysaccharide-induced tumor necrosis like protein n=1 Tax=Argiope bruennichi TaxID=94029 RepID=A0A8T0F323_ARGBR|nr:Lipopolysaccharide-induced tumor necrosis like protein [Argiope bruennichi]